MSPAHRTDSIQLVDAPQEARTTATLLASLAARLTTLQFISGPTAVGSIVAGFGALGRDASKTAEGARLRRALERGRASTNGEAIWDALKIDSWIESVPPSPILDHLRNDFSLLLAGDLLETIELLPIPGSASGDTSGGGEPPDFLDCVVGMWAFSRELVRAVESLAGPTAVGDIDSTRHPSQGRHPERSEGSPSSQGRHPERSEGPLSSQGRHPERSEGSPSSRPDSLLR